MNIIRQSVTVEESKHGNDILCSIERAGRTCYKSEDKINPGSAGMFVKMILKKGHESVLEHEKVTVRMITDRGVTHELVRHRIASYSQESTRYCNYMSTGITIILPVWYEEAHSEIAEKNITLDEYHMYPMEWLRYLTWKGSCKVAENAYIDLLRREANPQEARSVLPNSLKTEIVVTMNLREWRHFFRLRTSTAAHPQMRELAIMTYNLLRDMIPVVFDDIVIEGV